MELVFPRRGVSEDLKVTHGGNRGFAGGGYSEIGSLGASE